MEMNEPARNDTISQETGQYVVIIIRVVTKLFHCHTNTVVLAAERTPLSKDN